MLLQTLSEFSRRFPKDPLRSRFVDAMAFQQQVLNKLQRSVMKIRMVPVEQLFRRFPRVVRDVAKVQGKDVKLVLEGESTDLDKSIIDALAEPMTHLVRNAVDHGIESSGERLAKGKPAQGTIKLNAFHQGNQVVIEISDDGRGIDAQKVVQKAITTGVITAEDAARLSDSEKLNLIFHAGLSTADIVTEVSGRGVGMDIVKACMERLKGTVSIETEPGAGTTFRLKLPLTLAIIKALLFREGERLYAIPLTSVLEITRVQESEIHVVDQHEVIKLRDEVLTLVRLRSIGTARSDNKSGKSFIVVISLGERKFGLIVDKLVGEEELVIKALDDGYVESELVSGASILGDGTVVLILNLTAVVERLGRTTSGGRKQVGASA
jgi:two-component system chemotaxis sensor kinase CheA